MQELDPESASLSLPFGFTVLQTVVQPKTHWLKLYNRNSKIMKFTVRKVKSVGLSDKTCESNFREMLFGDMKKV